MGKKTTDNNTTVVDLGKRPAGGAPTTSPVKKILNGINKKIALTLVLLVAAIGMTFYMAGQVTLTGQCRGRASSPIYAEAAAVLDLGKLDQLEQVVSKIQTQPRYEKDQNCLYPVAMYYGFADDAAQARAYYDKLAAVYDEEKGFYEGYYNRRGLQDVKMWVDEASIPEQYKGNSATFYLY